MTKLAFKQTRFLNVRKEYKEQNRLRINFEKSLIRNLINMFDTIGRNTSKNYENAGKLGSDIYLAKTRPLVERTLEPFYFSVIKEFSDRFEKYYSKKLEDERVKELLNKFIFSQGSQRITQIDETTRKNIQKIIKTSTMDGLGQAETARIIEDRFKPQFSRKRASVIARTEVHSASSFTNHIMAKDLQGTGVNLIKQWVANVDDRVRDIHIEANGQKVPMDTDFTVGGIRMGYTGDPKGGAKNVINCRCITVYVEDDTTVYDSPTATSTTRMPKKRFYGYGDALPEERVFLEESFSKAPLELRNTINLFPALHALKQNADTGAYAHVVNRRVNYTRGSLKGHAFINMSAYDQREFRGQSVFRHEYGHTMDYQIGRILPLNRQKPEVEYNSRRRLREERTASGTTEFLYSANYANEINLDKALLRVKNPQLVYNSKNIKVRDDYLLKEQKKRGYFLALDDPKRKTKTITADDINYALADGKLFTRKELKLMLGGEKIDIIKELQETLKNNKMFNDFRFKSELYRDLLKIRYYNQKGSFGSGGFGGTNIFKDLKSIQKYILDKQKFGGVSSSSELITREYMIDVYADYLGAITNEKVGYGHGLNYYVKFGRIDRGLGSGNSTEAFANYITVAGADKEFRDIYLGLFKKHAPNTTKGFDEVLNELERYSNELNN